MLIAAVAVSVGCVPEAVPSAVAVSKSEGQLVLLVNPTHAARMLASVLSSL